CRPSLGRSAPSPSGRRAPSLPPRSKARCSCGSCRWGKVSDGVGNSNATRWRNGVNNPALLQAIRDEPGDDLPRLAYADWLEEHGAAPRGEMIRVQIELTRGSPDRKRALVLLRRLRELVVAHRREWLGPLVEVAPGRGVRVRLRRGAAPAGAGVLAPR